jgi:carbamoylphosphate synthase small subunit
MMAVVQVSGLVVSDYSEQYSHFEAVQSLHDWMAKEGILDNGDKP